MIAMMCKGLCGGTRTTPSDRLKEKERRPYNLGHRGLKQIYEIVVLVPN